MPPNPILISRKTAAALLSISIGMLDKLERQGVIEAVRLGKRVMYRRSDIEELSTPPSRRRALQKIDPLAPLQ